MSDLRAASVRYAEDEELAGMVADLRAKSARFAELWTRAGLVGWTPQLKTMRTPVGPIELHCDSLAVPTEDQRVLIYSVAAGHQRSGGSNGWCAR